jgi:predicted Zn finger-like uncharacterized protein
MLIKCPSCSTQAKIPSSKEGAKVKCPSCGHIYAARERGAKGSSQDPTRMYVIGGAILALVLLAVVANRSSESEPYQAPVEEEVKKEVVAYVDPMSWDGPLVGLARELQLAAATGNDARLLTRFAQQSAFEYAPSTEDGEEPSEAPDEAAEAEDAVPTPGPAWGDLDQLARIQWAEEQIAAVMAPGPEGPVAAWKPYDGSVVSLEGGIAIVHLRVQAQDPSLKLDDRWTRWVLKNLDGESGADDRWRWVKAERYISPEELAAMRRRGRRKAEKKTLSDGSVVYESELRTIPYDPEMPAEEQQRLTALIEGLVKDVDAPPRKTRAIREQVIEAGKPIVPGLLSKMSLIVEEMPSRPDQDEDDRIRLNFLHEALRDITGHETTFVVSEAMGGTQERIKSGLKQWFAWYDRKFKRFDGVEEAGDPLMDDPDFEPKTKEELREYNRALRQQMEEERSRKNG